MKVLLYHPFIPPYRIDLFNTLSKRYETDIVTMYNGDCEQAFKSKSLEHLMLFKPKAIKSKKDFFKILTSRKYDIIIPHEFGIVTIIAIIYRWWLKLTFRKSYRLIITVDDSYDMIANHNQFSWKHKLATRLMLPLVDDMINVEPRVVDYYRKHYGKGTYFPIICDDNRAEAELKACLPISERIIKEFNLEGKKILLYVGRLVELKNLRMVMQAYLSIQESNTTFSIIGDGPEMTKLKEIAKDRKDILFLGKKTGHELYAWYNIAQLFVLASWQEAFGAVTNEALQGGCRCLISELAGSQCLIKEGINGCTFNPHDQKTFTTLLATEIKNISTPVKLPLKQRKNMMPQRFDQLITNVIQLIEK